MGTPSGTSALPCVHLVAVALREVIDAWQHIEPVAVFLPCAGAWHLQPTAAKLGNKVGAVAATGDVVEVFARNRPRQQGLNHAQVTRVVGANE
jgi:hypothetical protein